MRFKFNVTHKLPNDSASWEFGVNSDDYDRGLELFLDGLRRLDTDEPADPISAAID